MQIENEVKVLDIDTAKVSKLLLEKGYQHVGSLNFRRYIFDVIPVDPDAWIRLRTDGKVTSLTYKKSLADAVDGVRELEVNVENFENTKDLLELAGHKPVSYQENNRELFKKGSVEISIDSWPHIPPYLEIEAKTKGAVDKILASFNFSGHKTTSLPTKEVYKIYGKNLDDYPELRFQKTG